MVSQLITPWFTPKIVWDMRNKIFRNKGDTLPNFFKERNVMETI
jgi:hypothetical protein